MTLKPLAHHFALAILLASSSLAAGVITGPTPAFAGALSDQIMAPGLFAAAESGVVLRYQLRRSLTEPPEAGWPGAERGIALPQALPEAVLQLSHAGQGPAAQLVLALEQADSPPQQLAALPAAGPNPVLLFWLENIVRAAAVQTGGSPFYLRNRIKEALIDAEMPAVAAGRIQLVLQPFATDARKAELGAFGGLTLTLVWDPARPAQLLELLADTGAGSGGYSEHLILQEN